MAKTQDNDVNRGTQAPIDDFDPETGEIYEAADAAQLRIDQRIHRKTITTTSIRCNAELAKLRNVALRMCRISGVISGTAIQWNPEHTQEFEALSGEFEAEVFEQGADFPGAVYYGGYCYLPGGIHEASLSRFKRAMQNAAPDVEMITQGFSLFLYAEPANNPRGYSWFATNAMRQLKTSPDVFDAFRKEAARVETHPLSPQLIGRQS